MERCKKPVICAIHSACVGGGVDLVTATDIRLATQDAWFCVKEVDMGLAADVGTLQRLPKVNTSDCQAQSQSQRQGQLGLVISLFLVQFQREEANPSVSLEIGPYLGLD